ncbi:MAG: hypothetical protein A2V66_13675 [Ignavibacteria bacterium RBG_13_36_8]|nr:MAG: hypothetical protein A2V66_13675 [Ignavibacteria bacterium RBG_13_36_8]
MTVIDILLIVLIIAASALCVYLIISLSKLNKSVDSLQKDIHQLIEKTIPVLENMNDATGKINKVITEAEGHWGDLNAAIESAKEKVSRLSLKSRFDKSENPIQQLIKNLSAIVKGISAFWSELTS